MIIRAAGILILAPGQKALFLKRGPGGDHPGEWCTPGGTSEGDETPAQTAVREAGEELGATYPTGALEPLARRIKADPPAALVAAPSPAATVEVDFTTFLQRVPEEFAPELNGEHVGYAWAPVDEPPEPLHPGVRAALARLGADELGIARMIAAGELTSPQRYQNVSLFAIRITGTGTAYRRGIDEFVYRRPEDYLTDEFLQRCNGLPVIWKHPKKSLLTSAEFGDRVIGTVLLPYIEGDEVWGIAKVYDADSIGLMETLKLSTSPAVLLRNVGGKITLEDGSTLLIEGKPSLLDHVAICEAGVWDKGGPPAGVRSETATGEAKMDDDEKKAAEEKAAADKARKDADDARAKADADAGTKLDKVLSHLDAVTERLDAMGQRMDGFEKFKADSEAAEDPEKVAADRAKKDADDAEAKAKEKADADAEEKAKADAASTAAVVGEVAARVAAVEKLIPKQLSDADYAAMAAVQERADTVFQAFGDSAPRPLQGEDIVAYRRRLAGKLQPHSADWKAIDLMRTPDDAFAVAEGRIYADAMTAASSPVDAGEPVLREIVRRDETGRQVKTFVGRPGVWMAPFRSQVRSVTRIVANRKDH